MSPQKIDYYDSPDAPRANSLVPAVNVVVVNDAARDPADPPHRQRQLGAPRRRDRPRRVSGPGGGPRDTRGVRDRVRDHRHRRHLLRPQARNPLHQQRQGTAGVLHRAHRPTPGRPANAEQRIKRGPLGTGVRGPRPILVAAQTKPYGTRGRKAANGSGGLTGPGSPQNQCQTKCQRCPGYHQT